MSSKNQKKILTGGRGDKKNSNFQGNPEKYPKNKFVRATRK